MCINLNYHKHVKMAHTTPCKQSMGLRLLVRNMQLEHCIELKLGW